MPSPVDLTLVVLTILLPILYLYRNSLPFINSPKDAANKINGVAGKAAAALADEGDPRDWVAKMEKNNKRCTMFYGSQTGTAEEYAIRLAKEAKSKFGISSLVCDPEEYDFAKLDAVPSDKVVFFVVATYGEGEPTDNAQEFMEFLMDPDVEFSQGREGNEKLDNLRYVIFGLGNRTYEHYNEVARKIDRRLTELGAKRIGERGEGDDDKSMEEDYLGWKDGMWTALGQELQIEEGAGGDVADFVVTEIGDDSDLPVDKIYHGELSARALLGTKGTHDVKNPYLAPIKVARELFSVDAERNCVHVEFDIKDSGMTYQHGDHCGVWPSNPDVEVERMLCVLGLTEKRHVAINIESLDPTLAKVPFPTPATYEAIFRHYIDISATASRQALAMFAQFAPTPEAAAKLTRLGTDKEAYHEEVDGPALKLAEVLQHVAGDDVEAVPNVENTTVWRNIPFDRIVSSIHRLQPRYYSISSSSKLHPDSIHITAVVLKYESKSSNAHKGKKRWVYGVGTNFILNVKAAHAGEDAPLMAEKGSAAPAVVSSSAGSGVNTPTYRITGPRDSHFKAGSYLVPIHVRRSTFRLPTSPKVPVIMIGPGTGVAPFRGFVQERLAAAKRTVDKAGPGASPEETLKDWADMYLFYGCRKEDEDFLYREEWPEYIKGLGGKLHLETAFSRGGKRKPDGSKIYVQDLVWDLRDTLTKLILEKRAYIYICGDAKHMAKSVEEMLMKMLGEAKGGTAEVEGAKEFKLLKERNRLLLDVWS
ncbi:hypothetical protein NliqN6_0809 [Naganishia liquefaciens]|uniref:NADPH--cytochrome P450 reductase n=1 Tax=Naganishia liquefaciens TaxID=104408 RepID=A0A8H3TNL3_9TREE|nr:hypothetical protein NliqN6_0809 [Naganishia liquefaciens]